jgi:glutamyl-tRNA synthetase
VIRDRVQGDVTIRNDQLDDMVLLRSDGTPVYMLAVVVDDHDMGVTHVIRGDDHLNNAARQMMIYDRDGLGRAGLGAYPADPRPRRQEAVQAPRRAGVEEYQAMGYPAAGMRNYLARLGWSHGDDEFFTDAQALEWFDLDGIGKSPGAVRFQEARKPVGQHIAAADDAALLPKSRPFWPRPGRPP